MKKILLSALFAILVLSAFAQEKEYQIACIAFYNVENLFDTIVDPDTNRILQEDFTPKGPKNWTSEKYFRKLDNIARVISDIGTELVPTGPAILGVSEVENKLVLEDLVKRPAIASRNYQIVHFQSQDERGVDVAFLYQPSRFKLISANHYPILLDEHDRTRDLVVMCGLLDGEKMYFMVDHWPSRGGGQKKSQPKRDSVASHDRSIIDSILAIEPDAKIIFMGDLNDDPIDESVTTFLNANGKLKKLKEGQLYNPMAEKYKKGIGTLGYNGTWNLFDQIILTQSFLGDDKSTYKFHKALVYNKKYLIQESGYYKGYPFRSFSGNDFIGGYSDHFPSYIYIIKENK